MSNEFVIKNGLISQGNITATGSLVVSQNITSSNISASGTISASVFSGAHTGSVFGTSSWATNALTASYVSSSNIVGTVTSASYALSSSFAVSSSFSATAGALVTTNNYTVNNITASATGSFGMIGVGTSSPLGKIDIRPDPVYPGAGAVIVDTDGGNNPRIRMYRPDGGSSTSSYAIHIRNDSGNLNILTSGTNTTLGSETVTSKFYFTSTGRLGIGTTGPQTTLDIIASNAAAVFRTDTSISSSYSGLRIYNDLNSNVRGLEIDYAGSAYAGALVGGAPVGESAAIVTTGAYPLVLGTNNTAKVTILSGGNVGIGSSNPTNKLEVVGNISASSFTGSHFGTSSWSTNALTASYVSSSNIVGTVTSASYALSSSFATTASALVPTNNYTVNNITASATSSFGRIGIGTSTIQNALTIGLVDATSSCLLIQSNTYNDLPSGVQITTQLGFLNGSSANLHFARWGGGYYTEHASVGQSAGPTSYDLQFSAGRQNTGSTINYFTSSAVRMTIKTLNGNVGIGTTNPANKFSVAGEAAIGSTYAGSNNAPANGLIVEGNVGIGSTSPTVKLDVVGAAAITSTGVVPLALSSNTHPLYCYDTVSGVVLARIVNTTPGTGNGSQFLLRSGSTDALALNSNGISYLNGGNVGIGTTNPVNKLEVVGNISASSFTGSHFGTSSYAQTASVAISASYAPGGSLSGGTTNYIPLWTGTNSLSSSVMYQSGAYVGVGLTNPMNRLDVAGNISCSAITASNFFGTSSWATNALTASNVNGGTNTYLARWTGNTSLSTGLIRDNGTDLGIGIAPTSICGILQSRTSIETASETAGYSLSLVNPQTGSTVLQTFRANSNYNAPAASSISGICSDFVSYTQVNSSGSTYAQIKQFYAGAYILTGSVTDKTSFFAANAAIGAGATVTTEHGLYVSALAAGTTIYGIRSAVAASAARWNLYIDGTAQNYLAGNVGIGITNPSYKLDVSGGDVNIASANILKFGTVNVLNTSANANDIYANIRVIRNESTVTQDGMYINYNSNGTTAAHLRFYANGVNERMRIDASNGYVGVGTSSPNTLLNVGSGTPSTAANGIQFGSDTSANLYRISTGVIKTDGGLTVAGTTTTVNALSASGGAFTNDIAVNGLTIGRGNGNSSINTAIGLSSLLNNYTSASFGINNTSIGANALRSNTSGSYNTSLGSLSEYFNTIGDYNTAVGYAGLYSNTIGTRNVAVGAWALFNNIAGEYNTALGYQASYTNISGSGNIGVGYRTLFNQLSGSYNTAIGYQASSNLTTGSNNIAIGYNAQLSNITSSNEIVIGDNNITLLRIPALGISATTSTLTATNISASGTISASVFSGVHTGSHFGTSSWSTNALTASSLALQTSYTINNASALAASLEVTGPANISGTFAVLASSGDNTASVFTVYGDNSPRTPRFTVTREGNVGIGTTNPLARLQLGNLTGVSTATPETINLGGTYSNSTGSNIKLKVFDDGASIGGMGVSNGQMEVVTWAAGKIAFYRGTTQTAIIDASGNVGIGTTNPVNKLQVAGNISCSAITASNFFGTSSWATNSLTASSLVIANSYQVASLSINTSSVLLPLTIHGTTYSASISGQAANSIFRIGGAGTNAILDMGVNADSSPGFSWLQARSKIDYSTFGNLSLNSVGGNVGVGTTTPSAKLSIGNGSISDGNIPVQISTAASSGLVYFGANKNGAYGALFGYDNSGYGGTVVRNVVSSGSSGDAMSFVVNSTTTAVYIKSDGNVGVGTTSPSYKLQVVGSFSATTKSFDIEHPTKSGKRLVYGSLESPYHGVRLTGKGKLIKGKGVIQLPDYINSLVDFDNANVQITNIKHNKAIYVDNIDEKNNIINVAAKIPKTQLNKELEFYWTFTAVRKDVPNLQVEL